MKMNQVSKIFVFCGIWMCIAIPPLVAQSSRLQTIVEWKQLEFDYATEEERQRAIDGGNFTPESIMPIDTDISYSYYPPYSPKVFVTIPRFQNGIPATFGTVTNRFRDGNPIIAPYPSWSWHRDSHLCKQQRIVSVFRTQIDECGRLWVLDTGRIGDSQLCPPQILAFDPQSNQMLHRYEIPMNQIVSASILVTPVIDVRGCSNTFVYIADVQGFSIIVYDVNQGRSWKISNDRMKPDPERQTFTILGDSFQIMDGVLGMSLSPYVPGYDRILFFHAMASVTENWVETKYIRDRSRFATPTSSSWIYHTFPTNRTTQSVAEAIDRNGIMYFGLVSNVTMNCWNIYTEYKPENFPIIDDNQETLQFPSGVKVITNRFNEQDLFVLTSRFQKTATGTLNTNEVNFRILYGSIPNLIKNTRCRR